jgi:hypothetical protein
MQFNIFFIIDFLWIFFQVGVGHTCPNTKPKVHTDIDIFFADVPKNLHVLSILASSLDVPQWNQRSSTYFVVFFAFANANLHDDGVFNVAHASDPDVSRWIHNWAHTEKNYVAENQFGMNGLLTKKFHLYIPNYIIQILCRLVSSSSRFLYVMSPFWKFGPQTSRTWVIISSEMVGSTTSPIWRTNSWGTTGCLGEVLVP